MKSVGRATARRWFSYTQNRQTESKIKKTTGGETDTKHLVEYVVWENMRKPLRESDCAVWTLLKVHFI